MIINCIDMVLCLSCLIFGDLFGAVESFYQIWKNCGHYFFKWFFCFCCPSVWYFPTVYYGSDFFVLLLLFYLCALFWYLLLLFAGSLFFFFHLQNAIWYWEFLVNFSFQILHFFMSRSSIWILHHLFFSWLCCGFL